jgi:ABC-type polysaccharide/polyol phosphate export permease
MSFHEFWMQVRELTIASIKSRYRKTWAGFLWVIMNPILMLGAQSLVFKKFMKIMMPDYFLFLLGGLLPWIFFTTTVQMGTPVFVVQSQLLRSFKINHWVVLCAQVLDGFVNFLASFLLILLPVYLTSDKSVGWLLLLPVALFPLLVGTISVTIIFSVLNVFYRDINFVMGFIFSLLFFLTPIFYPRSFVPPNFQWMINSNPIIYFIEPFRTIIHKSGDNIVFELFMSFVMSGLMALIAMLVWKRKKNEFYHRL